MLQEDFFGLHVRKLLEHFPGFGNLSWSGQFPGTQESGGVSA